MNEEEWLNATDPHPLLQYQRSKGKAGRRKLLLWSCACVRRIWPLVADCRSRDAVEVRERYEDGLVGQGELAVTKKIAGDAKAEALAPYHATPGGVNDHAREFAPVWAALAASAAGDGNPDSVVMAAWATGCLGAEWQAAYKSERAAQTALFRDIFRDPPAIALAWLAWNGSVVVKLAQAAYDYRIMPAGTLDPDRLGILADALEDAGADSYLVAHLREQGSTHVRGCFVLDLLLGKD